MILFDVDGTLIDRNDQARPDTVAFLRAAHNLGIPVGVWSGGGKHYAEHWVTRLGLEDIVVWIGVKERRAPAGTLFCVDDVPRCDFGVPLVYVGPDLSL